VTAAEFGLDEDLLSRLLEDPRSDGVDERLGVLLSYVAKVTTAPARLTAADADEVYAAGWPEPALRDAVAITALFNCMNRLVDGLGITASPDYLAMSGARLHSTGYAGLKDLL
jgi:alkylhydroperoxidase family enzyme